MKKKILNIFLMFILSLCITISTVLPVLATEENATVTLAKYYLNPYEDAVNDLKDLVAEKDIYALIYLHDTYSIYNEPEQKGDIVATVSSGEQVKIIGVTQDTGKNIWYQVSYVNDEETVTGYVERTCIACADERLLEWEDDYVKSSRLRSFFRASALTSVDIEQFPESYKNALYDLKQNHPNWTFVKMNTGLDWNQTINEESKNARSLIAASSPDSWKNGMYDNTSWAYCSTGIIKYYIDPRNVLSEKQIFQFEQLIYNESCHSIDSTQQILNGTFMNGFIPDTSKTYATAFMEIGKNNNISPTLLASRVRQEQGIEGTSPLISGNYTGYASLYNYYNIGASGRTTEENIISGLKKSRENGWTTRMLSLEGGASFIANRYIARGQDTLYLQKFDVDSKFDSVFSHQYMQNIQAPSRESITTYNAYNKAGLISGKPFVFKIPVYNNMPDYACVQPGSEDILTLSTPTISNLPVDQTAILSTYINGKQNTSVEMEFTSSNTTIATVSSTGVITAKSPGTITVSCKKAENSESGTIAKCDVTVIKADISLTSENFPVLNNIIYNPDVTLKDIALPTGYKWLDDAIVPTVNNEGYSVVYNSDESRYNNFVLTVALKVDKAKKSADSLSIPNGLEGAAGAELRSVVLPTNYTWNNPEEVLPQKIGAYTFKASYCEDVNNYEITTDISIPVTTICKTHKYGEWSGTHADCTHDGKLIRTCSVCGETETITEKALGHDYHSKVTKEPTVTQEGIRTYTCSRCNDSYTQIIPATGISPTVNPTATPITQPTATPVTKPTAIPTATPVTKPTAMSTATPTAIPTIKPTTAPTVTQETSTPKPVAQAITSVITPNVEAVDKPKTQSSTVNNTEIKNTPTQIAPEESINVVRINLQNSTLLTADKIGKLKSDEKEIQLIMPDDIMWNIDVSSIQNEVDLNVDMKVELGNADIPQKVIDSISEDEPYVLLSLAHDGPFNFDATLMVPVEQEYMGKIANLFYFNPETDSMQFIATSEIDENGYATFNMKHASDYAIVFAENSLETITNETQTTTEPDTIAQEVFNEQNSENESIENIILIVAVIVLIIVFLFVTGLIIKYRKNKNTDDYYLDEEDDEIK